jgi:TP901 family phage tail tape measure protein
MGIPLAAAFVRLEPDTNLGGFAKEGQRAGEAAGKAYGDGFYRDANGKLRDANGKFVKDSESVVGDRGGRSTGRKFGDSFSNESGGIIGRNFRKIARDLGPLLIPAGFGAAIVAIGQIGMKYEDALNIMQSVTKATGAQMDQVAAKARELGADITLPGVSAAGAAEAMVELSKAGFSVQQAMDAAKGTLQLARVANLSEADAAEIAANAVNAFGIQAKDTMFVVDELAAAANSSSIEVREASMSFKMAAAVFSGFQGPAIGSKQAITELNTAIAILGNNGIKGSDAGTSLKQMLLQLTGPTDKAQAYMDLLAARAFKANITLGEQNAILYGSKKVRDKALSAIMAHNKGLAREGGLAYDAQGKMRGLREIIDLVIKGTQGMTQEQRNAAITQIFGADASRAIIALMKGGLPVYDAMQKAITEQGAAADFAAAKNKGLRGAIDAVRSQLENAAIGIYNVVKGPLTDGLFALADGLGKAFKWIGDNIGALRDWAVAITAVTLAIKLNSLMLAVNAAGGMLAYLKTIRLVAGTTRIWATVQTVLNASLLANPIGLVIIALTALVAGVVLAYRHSETFRKIVDAAWAAIKVAIKATVDWFVNTAWPALKKAWDAVATAAMWLWRNVLVPAWNGIKTVIGVVVNGVKAYLTFLVAEFKIVSGVVTWLWTNIFVPVFRGIGKVVEIWWLAVRVIFQALVNIVRNTVGVALTWLYRNVVVPVFNAIRSHINTWWNAARAIFNLLVTYLAGPIRAALNALRSFFSAIFNGIRSLISAWWNTHLRPIFSAVVAAWRALSSSFSGTYNNGIKPLFDRFVGFMKNTVVGGFRQAVTWISEAWAKLRDAAKKPVEFVVNHVINPFINGLNKAAAIVGVKDKVEPIRGFAAGGQIPGFANGGRIAGMPAAQDNRQAMVSGLGPVKLMGGEFIVNAKDTARALPLLEWINGGMKLGGPHMARRMIGRPMAERPGDGSEGWAFKGGGLVGWVKDVWGAMSDPIGTIRKPFEAMLDRIPGVGRIKDFLIGSAKRLLGGAVKWLTGFGGGAAGGSVGRAQAFVRAQDGKPYVWASAGPGGYDCSGIVSAAYNILKGRNPYSHTFSTGSLPGSFFRTGGAGPLMAGWAHPGQRGASASVGHMAGQIGGLPFESRGSRGVIVGAGARRINDFAYQGAARLKHGGQVTPALFDAGGRWPSGMLGLNQSGHTEHVMTGGPGGDMDQMLAVLGRILDRLGELGGDVADALASNTRRGVARSRTVGRTA